MTPSREGGPRHQRVAVGSVLPGRLREVAGSLFPDAVDTTVLSEHILGEFVEHGLGKLNGTADQIDAAVADLRRRCQIVSPARVPADTISDANDLPVLGAAIAGQADCLSSCWRASRA